MAARSIAVPGVAPGSPAYEAGDLTADLSRLVSREGIEPPTFGLKVRCSTIECTRGSDCRPALAQFVIEQGWGLLEMRAIDASLEDIFLELTAEQASSVAVRSI